MRLHAWVSGRVQGVGFRASTRAMAQQLGLVGVVRNLHDGRVEVIAEGPRPALEALAVFLAEGPRMARVEQVNREYLPAEGGFSSFVEQRGTGRQPEINT